MEPKQIKDRITSVMSSVFEKPENEITEQSSADTIDTWDSLRHLNLILALEEEFGISIPDEDVGNMVNYKIIYHVMKDLL